MILKQFPDIQWLKKQAASNFADQTAIGGTKLPDKGWPSVVMNTQSRGTERNDITGPFSIFLNLAGKSNIRTEGLSLSVETDTYCITNQGQLYDLIVPEGSSTNTFNIHFGEKLFGETVRSLRHQDPALLDQPVPDGKISYETRPRTVWRDERFQWWIDQLISFYNNDSEIPAREREAEILSSFLEYILRSDNQEFKAMQSIPSLKPSTRQELMKRVERAIDYIHDQYANDITLDDVSEASALSKFHLQRTFKQVKGQTPQQYIAHLRLQKSRHLIEKTAMPISDVALATGFSDLSAFSRFFRHQVKVYPSVYREKLASRVK